MRPAFTKAQRLQVFEAFGAIVCCQGEDCDNVIRIRGADIDHHLALIDGGTHELSNWRPLCESCHAPKSAYEHKANAKAKRLAAGGRKRRGRAFPQSARKIQSRPFQKREVSP